MKFCPLCGWGVDLLTHLQRAKTNEWVFWGLSLINRYSCCAWKPLFSTSVCLYSVWEVIGEQHIDRDALQGNGKNHDQLGSPIVLQCGFFFSWRALCAHFFTCNHLSLTAAVVTELGKLLESWKMMPLRPCIACGLFEQKFCFCLVLCYCTRTSGSETVKLQGRCWPTNRDEFGVWNFSNQEFLLSTSPCKLADPSLALRKCLVSPSWVILSNEISFIMQLFGKVYDFVMCDVFVTQRECWICYQPSFRTS